MNQKNPTSPLPKDHPFPRLSAFLHSKEIQIEDNYYIGLASDNTWVQIGEVGYEDEAEKYLAACPKPSDW